MRGICDLALLSEGIVDGLTFRDLVEQDTGIHLRCHVDLLKCKVWGEALLNFEFGLIELKSVCQLSQMTRASLVGLTNSAETDGALYIQKYNPDLLAMPTKTG